MGIRPHPLTVEEYQWTILSIVIWFILPWGLQEILERKCGLAPIIVAANTLEEEKYKDVINKQLTKSLDIQGIFRIQARASIYFIKALYQFFVFVSFVFYVVWPTPEWFLDHFIYLKFDSVYHLPYLHVVASFIGYYSWECTANRYGKITWSVIIHHWFTVGICVTMLMERYTPFATWFGFSAVSTAFPINIALGFRAHFSNQYPRLTRSIFKFIFLWYAFLVILNLTGQVFLICNSLIYHYNESIHIGFIIVMCICIIVWSYDDFVLLKALKKFTKQKYENAQVLDRKSAELKLRNLVDSNRLRRRKLSSVGSLSAAGAGNYPRQKTSDADTIRSNTYTSTIDKMHTIEAHRETFKLASSISSAMARESALEEISHRDTPIDIEMGRMSVMASITPDSVDDIDGPEIVYSE